MRGTRPIRMALPSFLKRKDKAAPTENLPSEDGADVQAARTRARQRLIGATVLLAIGVVGFPLLFETEPRPVPLDVPVELNRKPVAAAPSPAPVAPVGPAAQAPAAPRPPAGCRAADSLAQPL